jgi:hypothetical protein
VDEDETLVGWLHLAFHLRLPTLRDNRCKFCAEMIGPEDEAAEAAEKESNGEDDPYFR